MMDQFIEKLKTR